MSTLAGYVQPGIDIILNIYSSSITDRSFISENIILKTYKQLENGYDRFYYRPTVNVNSDSTLQIYWKVEPGVFEFEFQVKGTNTYKVNADLTYSDRSLPKGDYILRPNGDSMLPMKLPITCHKCMKNKFI